MSKRRQCQFLVEELGARGKGKETRHTTKEDKKYLIPPIGKEKDCHKNRYFAVWGIGLG